MPENNIERTLKELLDRQTQIFDKALNYTRVVLGVGYGGFFVLWSGTRHYLPVRSVIRSAMLIGISLFLYIAYEVLQAGWFSYLAIKFAKAAASANSAVQVATALEQSSKAMNRGNRVIAILWAIAYIGALLSGFGGVAVLIVAWLRWLPGTLGP